MRRHRDAAPQPARDEASPGGRRLFGQREKAFVRHLGWALATLFVISMVTYGAVNVGKSAEDVAKQALGPFVTQEQLDAYIEENRLDESVVVRYGRWLGDFVQGDFGFSPVTQREVRPDVLPRLERSVVLALASLAVTLPLALVIGVFMARNNANLKGMSTSVALLLLSALPEFVVGIGLLMLFGVVLGVLPTDSSGLAFGSGSIQYEAYVLPTLTLVLVSVPYIAWVTRAAASEIFSASYTRAAVLRGLRPRTVTWDYVMRNAAVPIVNAVALNLVYLLGGVIVVETVFAFPGMGQALVEAIGSGDVITVQAIGLLMGAMFIGISLVADLFVIYFNPRLKTAAST